MAILKVRNWSNYQHYKDRNPPWVKLHFKMLSSKDWVMLDDASRVLAIASMLIASQSDLPDGQFDADPNYFKRVAYLDHIPDFKPLITSGFLEIVLADASACLQEIAEFRPETETETENKNTSSKSNGHDYFEEFWKIYPKKVGKGDAERAFKKIKKPAETLALIKTALSWQASQDEWTKENRQFCPGPAPYLNKKRWLDERQSQSEMGQWCGND